MTKGGSLPCVCTVSHSLTPNKNLEQGRIMYTPRGKENKYSDAICYLIVALIAILVLLLAFLVLWMGIGYKETIIIPFGESRRLIEGVYNGYRIRRDTQDEDVFRGSRNDDSDPFRNS